MKFLKVAILALFAAGAFTACKKENVKPSFSIEGSWTGKIGTGDASPTGQYALNIKPGGDLERISSNGSVSATGSWNLNGTTLTAVYFYSNGTVVDVSATVEMADNEMIGVWSNNGGEEGTFYLNKQ